VPARNLDNRERPTLHMMIDLHCHILHALDDGPKRVEDSIQIAHTLVKAGYRLVVATPHMVPGTLWMPSVEDITTQIMRLNQATQRSGLNLKIIPGMEIALDPQIPNLLNAGCLQPLGSSTSLLIEPPFQQLPPRWQNILFSVMATGHKIILAHPERCANLAARPDLIEELINTGVYLQVNWGSFLGHYGRSAERTANILARNGWIHFLATDSHHPQHPNAGQIRMAANRVAAIIGKSNLRQLIVENPMKALRNRKIRPMIITGMMMKTKKKRWWQLW
jgi:protein-tyrosine phosphatase